MPVEIPQREQVAIIIWIISLHQEGRALPVFFPELTLVIRVQQATQCHAELPGSRLRNLCVAGDRVRESEAGGELPAYTPGGNNGSKPSRPSGSNGRGSG